MRARFSPRKLLLPLVPLYRLGLWLRAHGPGANSAPVKRLRLPVVSIGNLSTGGSGKTPLTIALAKALAARGVHVDVLSRGYPRKSATAARVPPQGAAAEFGDEPLLITGKAGVAVYVAPDRYQAGLLAEGDLVAVTVLGEPHKPGIHLLDDGFQHRQLHRDADIVLLDRRDWTDSLLPAGNLREPREAALRADVVAIPAEDMELAEELQAWGWKRPVWRVRRRMEIPAIDGPAAAFCGIARPEQFFDGLLAGGLDVVVHRRFPDHHPYTPRDVEQLAQSALRAGAVALITTEKDQVRLGKLAAGFGDSLPLRTAGLTVELEEDAAGWLISRLGLQT
jgi:tetraacyldisaccharide 4'-kinase